MTTTTPCCNQDVDGVVRPTKDGHVRFPDEEREKTGYWWDDTAAYHDAMAGHCTFCGQRHPTKECPNYYLRGKA